jgi:mono/diheme cytochrome c family protein
MNKYDGIALIALLILVALFPIYGLMESGRMDRAQVAMVQGYLDDGVEMYVGNCIDCHGYNGEGVGSMPALNNPALAEADASRLEHTIATSPHGSAMAAWHVDEGGTLNTYQVQSLVTLIQQGGWERTSQLAEARGIEIPVPVVKAPRAAEELNRLTAERAEMDAIDIDVQAALLGEVPANDPHACSECHEEPDVHADRFGLQCARCHGLAAWEPALLTRHVFDLDHGGDGQPVACETCHTENYYEHDCYACHNEHQPEEMQTAHVAEGIFEFDDCISCHPTGQPGEGEQFQRILALRQSVDELRSGAASLPAEVGSLGGAAAHGTSENR